MGVSDIWDAWLSSGSVRVGCRNQDPVGGNNKPIRPRAAHDPHLRPNCASELRRKPRQAGRIDKEGALARSQLANDRLGARDVEDVVRPDHDPGGVGSWWRRPAAT